MKCLLQRVLSNRALCVINKVGEGMKERENIEAVENIVKEENITETDIAIADIESVEAEPKIEFLQEDIDFMKIALEEANSAYDLDETPIGAVIVYEGKVIARACNRRNTEKNALAHAEVLAINEACKVMGDWRLEECTLYVTLEPCPMCAGAIVQARVPRVVFGASSPKAGFGGSVINILEMDALNHRCEVTRGVCEEETAMLLKKYFKAMRQKK